MSLFCINNITNHLMFNFKYIHALWLYQMKHLFSEWDLELVGEEITSIWNQNFRFRTTWLALWPYVYYNIASNDLAPAM